MPGQDLEQVAATLAASGLPADTPCVAVTDVSRPDAAYTSAPLSELKTLPTSSAPTLLLVGQALETVLQREAIATAVLKAL